MSYYRNGSQHDQQKPLLEIVEDKNVNKNNLSYRDQPGDFFSNPEYSRIPSQANSIRLQHMIEDSIFKSNYDGLSSRDTFGQNNQTMTGSIVQEPKRTLWQRWMN
jgi:hypothetical protein